MPCISSSSSSGRKLRLLPSPVIGAKVPRSNLFVQRIKPEPSQNSIFNRFRARLTKTNKNPDVGSCPRLSLTSVVRPLKLFRPTPGILAWRGKAQHGWRNACTTGPIHSAVASWLNRTTKPPGRFTSATQLSIAGSMVATLSSWNTGFESETRCGLLHRVLPFW